MSTLTERWLGYRPERSYEPELMDAPDADEAELFAVYRELDVINRRLGGHPVSIAGVRRLVPEAPLDVLDVGAGGGDFGRVLASWARKRNRRLRYRGIELSEAAVRFAQRHSVDFPELSFEVQDLHELSDDAHDVVHMALTLHHFDDDAAVDMLQSMARVAKCGLVVNDLHRHVVAYAGIKGLTKLLSRSRFVRNDGPLSVNRAFSRQELLELCRRADLELIQLRWAPMFRWLLVARRRSG
ncbi:MAG: methyltransferase domain-containing protein [Myxococcota bacterium]